MRLRALFVLPVVVLFTGNVAAEVGTATGLIPPRAPVAADSAGRKVDGQINGASWSVNAPIPEPRGSAQGSTVASSDGSLIYSIGGGCCSIWPDGIDRVWAYTPSDDSWSARASFPLSTGIRSFGAAVEVNGFVYVFGGATGPFLSSTILNSTWIYDEANDAWFQGANMPDFRFGSAVATDGAVIWVIGGYKSLSFGDVTNTVWMYDPNIDVYSTEFANMPTYLGRIHGVELPDGTVHVFGGDYGMDHHLVYNTGTDAWSSAPRMPAEVLDPAVVTDGTLIYLGGRNGDVPRPPGLTQIYDPANGTWSEGPPMPAPAVNNTSGTIVNGAFYVIGGYDGTGPVSVNYSLPLSDLSAFSR